MNRQADGKFIYTAGKGETKNIPGIYLPFAYQLRGSVITMLLNFSNYIRADGKLVV